MAERVLFFFGVGVNRVWIFSWAIEFICIILLAFAIRGWRCGVFSYSKGEISPN